MINLVALPSRAIMIRSSRGPHGCVADARATIQGVSAVLQVIYVNLGTFGVQWVEIRGARTSDHRRAVERINP